MTEEMARTEASGAMTEQAAGPNVPSDSIPASTVAARIFEESEHPIRESMLDREALKVLYRLRDAGFKGYLVGGGVRDLYLGRTPKDFDISTDARPGQLRRLFRNSRTIGRRFRLVQVFFRGNKIIEVSTLRSSSEFDIEGSDAVLPANNTFGTLEDDAFRRDLTINSLFYEIEHHTIIDYTGGVQDLNDGIIRMVGDPDRRFTRDPVRMMRVVRHAARTGFVIEAETLAAVARHRDKLRLCPPSRIRDEILKDLQSGACRPWAALCMRTTVWDILFPVYEESLQGTDGEAMRASVLRVCSLLDKLHAHTSDEEQVKVPESFILAALLLPWACARFHLPDMNARGQKFHRLLLKLREDVDTFFGRPLNVQRMAKESISSLLINLSTFQVARSRGGEDPKWLKKKSYYRDCAHFYDFYLAMQGTDEVQSEWFVVEPETPGALEVVPEQNGESHSGARGRHGVNPAFSSTKHGVFGLRKTKD